MMLLKIFDICKLINTFSKRPPAAILDLVQPEFPEITPDRPAECRLRKA